MPYPPVASGPVLQWVSARSPGSKRSAPSSRRAPGRPPAARARAPAQTPAGPPPRAPRSQRPSRAQPGSTPSARGGRAQDVPPRRTRRRRRSQRQPIGGGQPDRRRSPHRHARDRRRPPPPASRSAATPPRPGSSRWSSTWSAPLSNLSGALPARPPSLAGKARLLQVLAGHCLRRLLVEVDAGVQLLHHLGGQALLDLGDRRLQVGAGLLDRLALAPRTSSCTAGTCPCRPRAGRSRCARSAGRW